MVVTAGLGNNNKEKKGFEDLLSSSSFSETATTTIDLSPPTTTTTTLNHDADANNTTSTTSPSTTTLPAPTPIKVITAGGQNAVNDPRSHNLSPTSSPTSSDGGLVTVGSGDNGNNDNSKFENAPSSGQNQKGIKAEEKDEFDNEEEEEDGDTCSMDKSKSSSTSSNKGTNKYKSSRKKKQSSKSSSSSTSSTTKKTRNNDVLWLVLCFLGIMISFVCYGLLLEFTTSGGRELHELSFLFVTSLLYTLTAAAGRYVRDETPTTIPPARFAVLGLTSMGSTFCSVRSLKFVIYPIQVLAKSCKPVPVMIMGAFMGKKYPLRKYINVILIVGGVGLFMGGGDSHKSKDTSSAEEEDDEETTSSSPSQIFGILLLFVSLCFDGGTGAYEDKLMSVHSVGPFDLMYNIQLGKTILAGVTLLVRNQVGYFLKMCREMGLLLVALGLSGALGQVFIFVTIAKFGALTCSIIGLSRKVTTLLASIYFYGHDLNGVQGLGLLIAVGAMVMNFLGKKDKKGGHGGGHGGGEKGGYRDNVGDEEERQGMLKSVDKNGPGDVELGPVTKV